LSKDDPAYQRLFASIWYDNGSASPATFNLPNCQGYFLRGTDRGQGRDPNAADRPQAAPGGLAGDCVGSAQHCATGPARTPMTASFPHLPTKSGVTIKAGDVKLNVANWADGPSSMDLRGGDWETRPLNANIAFYIKYRAT
jgi:hypothetical protein